MDEQPVVNGRVSSRELYAALHSVREELASGQRAQAAALAAGATVWLPRLLREHRTEIKLNLAAAAFATPDLDGWEHSKAAG